MHNAGLIIIYFLYSKNRGVLLFFDELTNTLGQDINALKNFSYFNVANKGLIINGHNEIVLCTSCKIVLSCNKKFLYIYGQNMQIICMTNTEFSIGGDIWCVSNKEVTIC